MFQTLVWNVSLCVMPGTREIQERRAFLYSNGTMSNLGVIGGFGSYASAINDSGQIVGVTTITSVQINNGRAFLYENGVMNDLGTLFWGDQSVAYDINNAGQIVGSSKDDTGLSKAILYMEDQMLDLCALSNCLIAGWDYLKTIWY